jgi:spore coat polysaccharide biosynthesis protein SpsF
MPGRAVAIIQARMASSRLPGKVLLDIAGRPMLGHVYQRTTLARHLDTVVVATTTDASDDPVREFCQQHRMACVRGSQYDVLERYYAAARQYSADLVVRVTADCPVIDPELMDEAIYTLLGKSAESRTEEPGEATASELDFVANRLPPPFHRTFPIGLDVEVCTFAALESAWKDAKEPQQREHVMPYLYEGVQLSTAGAYLEKGTSPRGFRIGLMNTVPDLGSLRWTVDTPEDLEFIRQLFARLGGRSDFSWKDVLAIVQREPELTQINAGIRHNTLGDVDARALKR